MYRLGLVNTLVTHANKKGLGPTPLFGDLRGFMPPQLKTKQTRTMLHIFDCLIFHYFLQLTSLTSAAKRNERLVSQKLCNTVLILDAAATRYILIRKYVKFYKPDFALNTNSRRSCQSGIPE